MTSIKSLALGVCCVLAACTSDVRESEAEGGGTIRFVGNSFIYELRDGAIARSISVEHSPDHQLQGPMFGSDGETAWGVTGDSLAHWDLMTESLIEDVALPSDAFYDQMFLTDDAIWLVGGAGTVWVTKVTKRPLGIASTLEIAGKWFNGGHVTANGLDVLVSNGTEVVRIDTESATIVARVELNPKAGIADMVVIGDEYWIALRGSYAESRFVRLSVADLSVVETSTEPAPWPGHGLQYGYQRAMANDHSLYAKRSEYTSGQTRGCIVRMPLDEPSQSHDLFCVDSNDDTAVLGDLFVHGEDIWVIDDLYGSFVRIDPRTGAILERIEEGIADGFFL